MSAVTVYRKDYQVSPYLIEAIDLTFDLNENGSVVDACYQVKRNPFSKDPTQHLCLDGDNLNLVWAKIDGQELVPAQYTVDAQKLTLLNVPQQFELKIRVKIFPENNTALSGLYRSRHTYCTQCEAEGFRRITYFLDRPDVLSRYTVTIFADEKFYPYLLSNGNLVEKGQLSNGRHFAKWQDPFKKPSYLFALVAGDFDVIEDHFTTQSNRLVHLKIYVEKGLGDQAYHALDALKAAMRWDEQAFGREYDLDIYMIVAINDFNMGAMENKGLNIFNTKYILAKPETATDDDYIHILSVVGHEYFHNWSGNRVTCRDWFQLSLKEGLTIFRDQSFSEDLLSRAVMRIKDVNALRESQFPEDAGPLAHSVRPDSYMEINNFYTSTIYNKGAEVLRMLQTIVGKSLFRQGMDLYFTRFDGMAATIDDLMQIMAEVSQQDLQQFMLWYSQAGTPEISVQSHYDEIAQTYTLTFSQTCPNTPGQTNKQPMHIPVRMALLDQRGEAIDLYLDETLQGKETVLQLKASQQVFKFTQVKEEVLPSLLRNFSAPVKLSYPYADADLLFLFRHDQDPFNRYEAAQNYFLHLILTLVSAYQTHQPFYLADETFTVIEEILQNPITDHYLLAEMLLLPSEKYIGQQMLCIEVDAIHAAREFVLHKMAEQLQTNFLKLYKTYHTASTPQFDIHEIGRRQLKNRCLAYLMQLPEYTELGMQQFSQALKLNMTDTLSALVGLSHIESPLRQEALDRFYTSFQQDDLVVDKWFAIQAASQRPHTLEEVKWLLKHPAFDIKNPNKVYALIGSFGRNAMAFHAKTGKGYELLAEIVLELDKINPQIAARMVNPLTSWKRYDKERQNLMRKQLEMISLDKKISRDVYELITKSL